jgi:hypothetical protein
MATFGTSAAELTLFRKSAENKYEKFAVMRFKARSTEAVNDIETPRAK